MQITDGVLDRLTERSQHRPLVVPEEICRAEDDAGDRNPTIQPIGLEGSQENEEFTDEAIRARQADRRQPDKQEKACEQRGLFGHAAE